MKNICVLIVTYNRLNKLKKSLEAYDKQIVLPKRIVVVDNCSNDGKKEYLVEWEQQKEKYDKKIIFLDKNYGGSGGFYEGMRAITNEEFDWLWIADDDAYPEAEAFKILNTKIEENKEYDVICSAVLTAEGIDIAHRKTICSQKNYLGTPISIDNYSKSEFDINIFSFVGACISRNVLKQCGFPMKEFFIWFDDTEYSLRVNEKFKMMCVPDIKVFHDTIIEKEWRYSWKTYYGERNKLYTLEKHLSPDEFNRFLLRYKLGMFKHFFTDYYYYLSQRDGYIDYKNRKIGISERHLPGKYKYKREK